MGNIHKENGSLPQIPVDLKPVVPPKAINHSQFALATWDRWRKAVVDVSRSAEIAQATMFILTHLPRYTAVGDKFGIPAWVIGVIHLREASFDFKTWLANGDSLSGPTHHVPAGLGPVQTWEEGAELSLKFEGWHQGMDWDLANALVHLEAYNGLGYSHMGVPSPYIWAGTNIYHSGKYTADGHYDPSHVDGQLGCASVALALKNHGMDLREIPVV